MTSYVGQLEQNPDYGWTLKLDSDGDLSFNSDNTLEVIGGKQIINGVEVDTLRDKISQDLRILFRTMLGDNLFHTSMGLDFVSIIGGDYQDHIVKPILERTFLGYAFANQIKEIKIERTWVSGGEDLVWTITVYIGVLGPIKFEVGF